MYKPSLWFVSINLILLTAALLASKGHLLVLMPIAGSCILLGYCYSVMRQRQNASRMPLASREKEVKLVEKHRYLLAKEALLAEAKRKHKQLRNQK